MDGKKKTVFVGGPIQYAINDGGVFDTHLKTLIQKALIFPLIENTEKHVKNAVSLFC